MIIFKTIRYKNILSTGNEFTEIKFDSHSTTLIVGENGAGKSTILDALSYVLFSKPFRKITKPQLLNSITTKNLVVEIDFSIGTNEYKIVRGMKPNIFEVYQNNKLLNPSADMRDYQEILEKQILNVNHKSFCQVVVLGSATFQPFMQLTTSQRREIIEDLLDLQIFTTMNFLLKNKVQKNNEDLSTVATNKRLIEEKLKLIKAHMLEIQNNNDQIIEEKKVRIEQARSQIEELNIKYSETAAVIKDLEANKEDDKALGQKLNRLSSLKHQIEAKLNILKKEVNFFNENDDCPTCKQKIDTNFKCEAIEHKNSEIFKINDGLGQLSIQYDSLSNKIKEIMDVNTEINDYKMDINLLKTKINSLTTYIDDVMDEISNIKKKAKKEDNSKLDILREELESVQAEHDSLSEEKHLLSATGVLLKDGGIKSRIIKQYIPIINKLINKYLSSMEFMCQFELDENFNETIKSRHRDEFSYASFSEGEKMRINLAILFTWRAVAKLRNSINTNILIMDEVFDSSLDSNGTEEFMKILNSLAADTNTFIISHKTDQLYDKFEKVIRFEKYKNFSRAA